jgi:hypothetical protein
MELNSPIVIPFRAEHTMTHASSRYIAIGLTNPAITLNLVCEIPETEGGAHMTLTLITIIAVMTMYSRPVNVG